MTRSARALRIISGLALMAVCEMRTAEAAPTAPNLAVACAVSPGIGAVSYSPAAAPVRRTVGQVHHFERANMTLGLRTNADGSYEVEGRSGELLFRKTVQASGQLTLHLEARKDAVTVALTDQLVTVTRQNKTMSFLPTSAGDEDLNRTRRLLADSRAVVLLRAAAASVQESDEDSPAATAVLAADAVVGMLTGDVGAPRRTARHLARHALSNVRPAGLALDCYSIWETHVMYAWNDYAGCVYDVMPWQPLMVGCAFRWTLQVESYWWQFIGCSSFPF